MVSNISSNFQEDSKQVCFPKCQNISSTFSFEAGELNWREAVKLEDKDRQDDTWRHHFVLL